MKIIVLSIISLIIGIWAGKKVTDFKWIFSAIESYSIEETDGWQYKVEQKQKSDIF